MADKSYMLKRQFSYQIEYLRSTGGVETAKIIGNCVEGMPNFT
jgi:hypothetical protein